MSENKEEEKELSYLEKRQAQIFAGRPLKDKKIYSIPKISEKRKAKLAQEKELRGDGDSEKQKWFKSRIKQMSGHCAETGLATETRIYRYAINSICHILSQQHCKSVALHPLNWIELDPGFHVKFDAMSWEEREKLGCWPVIMERLIMVYPDIIESEKRFFPESVRKYIEINNPFDL